MIDCPGIKGHRSYWLRVVDSHATLSCLISSTMSCRNELSHFFYHGQTVTCWSDPTSGRLKLFGREEFISAWTLGWKNKLSHYAAHGLSCTMSLTAFPNFWAAVPLGHYYKTAACSILFRLHVWTHYFPRLIQQNLCQLGIQVKTTSKLMSFYGLKKWYCTNSTTWLFPRRSQLVHM